MASYIVRCPRGDRRRGHEEGRLSGKNTRTPPLQDAELARSALGLFDSLTGQTVKRWPELQPSSAGLLCPNYTALGKTDRNLGPDHPQSLNGRPAHPRMAANVERPKKAKSLPKTSSLPRARQGPCRSEHSYPAAESLRSCGGGCAWMGAHAPGPYRTVIMEPFSAPPGLLLPFLSAMPMRSTRSRAKLRSKQRHLGCGAVVPAQGGPGPARCARDGAAKSISGACQDECHACSDGHWAVGMAGWLDAPRPSCSIRPCTSTEYLGWNRGMAWSIVLSLPRTQDTTWNPYHR